METLIIDADRHISEPPDLWQRYLPESLKRYAPYPVEVDSQEAQIERARRLGPEKAIPFLPELYIDGYPLFNVCGEGFRIERALQSSIFRENALLATTPQLQLESMDHYGISAAYLFPTITLLIINHAKITQELSQGFAQAYNEWLFDYCSLEPDRLLGVPVISQHVPSQMPDALREIVRRGWSCVVLRPEMIQGRVVGHPDYAPFWALCEELDIAVVFHGSTHLQGPTVGTERFSTRFALHACSHPIEAQMAFLSMLESGTLERYPGLKIAFLEAGASWLPHWLWRLDELCYHAMPGEVADQVRMPPSEYFKRNCWIGFEVGEPCLRQTIDTIGADRLLFGTDFPHPDHLRFLQNSSKTELSFLTPDEHRLIFEQNAHTFFGH